MDTTATDTRSLLDITREIRQTWVNKDGVGSVNYAARPYLEAMEVIARSGNDHNGYFMDDASVVVMYFLSNATSYRGEAARRIKDELKRKYDLR